MNNARISRLRLAAFTLPVLLFQAIELIWRAYLPRFLTLDVGITLGAVGGLMLGARLLDAIADPVLGWLSDTIRTPLGQRKPWMAIGALLVPIGSLALFLAPAGSGLIHIMLASAMLHLGYSFIVTPHGGWGLELSDDTHQRTRIMGAKIWFSMAGAISLLALMAVIERGFALSLRVEMALVGGMIAFLAPLTVFTVLSLFTERAEPVAAPASGGPLTLIQTMLRDRRMRPILLLYVLSGIGDAAAAGTFLFVAEDALGLEGWGALLMLVQPVVALMTLPLWGRLSARIGRRHVLMIAYGWQALTMPFLFLVPIEMPLAFAAWLMARALGWGVDYMLLRAMVADLADQEGKGVRPMAGSYYGISSITLKLAMGVGGGGALWFLDLLQSESGGSAGDVAIRLAHVSPAIAATLAALLILARWPSTGRHNDGGPPKRSNWSASCAPAPGLRVRDLSSRPDRCQRERWRA